MEYIKITAIIRSSAMDAVEEKLKELHICGLSISTVQGFGEYANLYRHDWMAMHTKLEIFTDKRREKELVEAIIDTAHVGAPGDGIVAVQPVDTVYRIHTKGKAECGEI